MSNQREQQVRDAIAEAEAARAWALQRDEALAAAYETGWKSVNEALRMLEPINLELIARRVRAVEPAAMSVRIDATDQGGPGWVYAGDNAALSDDDELSILLRDLGEFMSSEDHPAQDLQLPLRAGS